MANSLQIWARDPIIVFATSSRNPTSSWLRSFRVKFCDFVLCRAFQQAVRSSAASFHTVLVKLVLDLDGVMMEEWPLHCGRGVSHHSGFIPFLLRCGVISKLKNSTKKTTRKQQSSRSSKRIKAKETVQLGTGQGLYEVRRKWTPKTMRLLTSWLSINSTVEAVRTPRSADEWTAACQLLTHAMHKAKVISKVDGCE